MSVILLEVVKNMIEDKLLKQSPLYNDLMEEGIEKGIVKGRGEGAENTILTALAARFGAVSDRLSERIHNLANETAHCWTN